MNRRGGFRAVPQSQKPQKASDNPGPSARKLALLKKSGVFTLDTKGCSIERACTLQELRAAYALVHDVFVDTGYIHRESGNIRLRIFEACPETATFVAKKDDVVVGVLSVVLDSPEFGLPSDVAFKPELDSLRKKGLQLCEATNQAIAAEYRRSAVLSELMRCATSYMLEMKCDQAIATVSPNHGGFYELMGFKRLGPERSYSQELHDPVITLCGDLTAFRKARPEFMSGAEEFVFNFLNQANGFRCHAAEWSRQATRHFLSADLLKGLLLGQRNFLKECSLSELLHLRDRWGRELFDAVWSCSSRDAASDLAVSRN